MFIKVKLAVVLPTFTHSQIAQPLLLLLLAAQPPLHLPLWTLLAIAH
jgi:hypothetical protein